MSPLRGSQEDTLPCRNIIQQPRPPPAASPHQNRIKECAGRGLEQPMTELYCPTCRAAARDQFPSPVAPLCPTPAQAGSAEAAQARNLCRQVLPFGASGVAQPGPRGRPAHGCL